MYIEANRVPMWRGRSLCRNEWIFILWSKNLTGARRKIGSLHLSCYSLHTRPANARHTGLATYPVLTSVIRLSIYGEASRALLFFLSMHPDLAYVSQSALSTPTDDAIEALIQQATSAKPSEGRPLRDTRTQLFVGNVRLFCLS